MKHYEVISILYQIGFKFKQKLYKTKSQQCFSEWRKQGSSYTELILFLTYKVDYVYQVNI